MAFIRHDAVEWPKQPLYFNFKAKAVTNVKQNASSNICAKLDPNWTDQGDTWVSYLYLTPSFFNVFGTCISHRH